MGGRFGAYVGDGGKFAGEYRVAELCSSPIPKQDLLPW